MYALLVADDFILVPNLCGLALFALQILVYRWHAPFCGLPMGGSIETSDGETRKLRSSTPCRDGLLTDTDTEVGPPSASMQVEPLVSPVADVEDAAGRGAAARGGRGSRGA